MYALLCAAWNSRLGEGHGEKMKHFFTDEDYEDEDSLEMGYDDDDENGNLFHEGKSEHLPPFGEHVSPSYHHPVPDITNALEKSR